MSETSLDSFEKLLESKINKIKPRSKQRGYARDLVDKLYPTIKSALEKGCSYEEIVDAISDRVKISPITLKQYHQANKRKIQSDIVGAGNQSIPSNSEAEIPKKLDSKKDRVKEEQTNFSQENNSEKSSVISTSEKKSEQIMPHLTGASLTDEDYLKDFNDY